MLNAVGKSKLLKVKLPGGAGLLVVVVSIVVSAAGATMAGELARLTTMHIRKVKGQCHCGADSYRYDKFSLHLLWLSPDSAVKNYFEILSKLL